MIKAVYKEFYKHSMTLTKYVLLDSVKDEYFTLLKQPESLDPSSKTDLDFRDCFGKNDIRLVQTFFVTREKKKSIL